MHVLGGECAGQRREQQSWQEASYESHEIGDTSGGVDDREGPLYDMSSVGRPTPASAASGPTDAAPPADQWSARQQQAELGPHTLRQNGLQRNTMMTDPVPVARMLGAPRSGSAHEAH